MRTLAAICVILFAQLVTSASAAPSTQPAISISVVTEEGEKLIRALVQSDGKPVENASVRFFIKRTFGNLLLGEDKTLDDGTAAVKFPKNLPGGATGQLHVIAEIKEPPESASRAETDVGGGANVEPVADPFPWALWAPHAPLPLVLSITILLAGVWSTYIFVVSQIIAIRKGARS